MIRGPRMVMESQRAFRAHFAKCKPIDIAVSPFMAARRIAARRLRSRMPSQKRAFQALNCCGVRIWVDKPRQFGGRKWRAECATVSRSIERREAREWLAVAERWVLSIGVPF